MTLRGVDLSFWQTSTPDLTGLSFVIARTTYGTTADDRYAYHAANVRRAGLALGAYGFGTAGDGAAQARALLSAAPDADFWVLDLEANGADTMPDAEARRFIAAVQATGRKIGLYHSLSGFPHLGQDWDLVAAWDGIDPGTGWTFHQYRGAPLDLDEFNGDATAFASFLAAQRKVVTKPSIGPAAEPVVWTGIITSVLLGALQYATGHGLLTGDQAASLTPQVAVAANGIATILPILFSLVTRQVTTPTSQIPQPVTPAPIPAPSLPVTPSTGVSPVATILSSTPLSAGTEGTIPAGTRRWSLDGDFLGTIGPSTLVFVSLDQLSGPINGSFYRTGTAPNVYVEASAPTFLAATAPAAPPAAPAPPVFLASDPSTSAPNPPAGLIGAFTSLHGLSPTEYVAAIIRAQLTPNPNRWVGDPGGAQYRAGDLYRQSKAEAFIAGTISWGEERSYLGTEANALIDKGAVDANEVAAILRA